MLEIDEDMKNLTYDFSNQSSIEPASYYCQRRPLPFDYQEVWLMNFFRFEALEVNGRKIEPSIGWALSVHGIYD
ncbi:MAG: hypothetical protein PHQ25_04075 [Acidobacteriota bacterium]|nr:hypothetical protein [Acidobacteriota bacterium]